MTRARGHPRRGAERGLAVLERIAAFFNTLTETQILLGSIGLIALLTMSFIRSGLGLYIAAITVSIAFATAADLRKKVPFLQLLPLVLAVPLFFRLFTAQKGHRWPSAAWIWVMLIGLFAVRSMFSELGVEGIQWWIFYFFTLTCGLSIGNLLSSPTYRDTMVRWLAFGSIAVILLGLLAIVVDRANAYTQGRLTPYGVQANIWGPNSLVAFMNAFLFVEMSRGATGRFLKITLLVVAAGSLLLTLSRGAIFAGFIMLGIYFLIAKGNRGRMIIIGGILAAGTAGALVYGVSKGAIQTESVDRVFRLRDASRENLQVFLFNEHVVPNFMFGKGVWFWMDGGRVARSDAHNSIMQIWIEQGTFGLALLCGLLALITANAIRAYRRSAIGSPERILAQHAIACGIALFLDGLTVPHLFSHHALMGFEFAILGGTVAGLARVVGRPADPRAAALERALRGAALLDRAAARRQPTAASI